MNYNIDGLIIKSFSLTNSRYRYIRYAGYLCEIVIATDDWGTQICYDGMVYGKSFNNLEEGVEYLREHKKDAVKFFRKLFLFKLKSKFSWRYLRHLYWKIRHYFNPNFYFN